MSIGDLICTTINAMKVYQSLNSRFFTLPPFKKVLSRLSLELLLLVSALTVSSVQANTDSTASENGNSVSQPECVILLHGLARTAASMSDMQRALVEAGYVVANIDYPSRKQPIEELSGPAVDKGIAQCSSQNAKPIHFVTHSMGGILVRHYINQNGAERFGKTIMLGPPNNGSEAVDGLKDVPGFIFLNGPAGLQMGTDEFSVPLKLGPAKSEVAVIAGTFSINWVLSTYLPDPDDGKVSVESTKLKGMCAHLEVNVSHPFIMEDEEVIAEAISYLQSGKFISSEAQYPDCAFR